MVETAAGPDLIRTVESKAHGGEKISPEEALELLNLPSEYIMPLMSSADSVRRFYKGNAVSVCSIVNARSGRCPEDCAFCPQSVHSGSDVREYGLMEPGEIVDAAKEAVNGGAHKFGIVTSGKGPEVGKGDMERICDSIRAMKEGVDVHRCASLGVITDEDAVMLREAGLNEFHHNLETARSFYHNICTTRTYDENVEAVRAAKRAGMRVCSGGIFGMGENNAQRVELMEELRKLDVDSIPLNFLNPVKGTRLENKRPLRPLEILKIIAVFRFYMPDRDIKVAGGREVNLRDLQSLIFFAGANSTMIGNYLTTSGRKSADDLRMIDDLELEIID